MFSLFLFPSSIQTHCSFLVVHSSMKTHSLNAREMAIQTSSLVTFPIPMKLNDMYLVEMKEEDVREVRIEDTRIESDGLTGSSISGRDGLEEMFDLEKELEMIEMIGEREERGRKATTNENISGAGTERERTGERGGERTREERKYYKVVIVPIEAIPSDYTKYVESVPFITFEADSFQKQALYHLSKNNTVFVSAHTSSGKTLIAEYAIHLSTQHRTKTIYTSPIKALSNQKYRDFSAKFESVGIMTGDAQINTNARCIIMTTEILRNMLYRSSDILQNVEFIIFDEIHYINDRERGVVWEEAIILLPSYITLVFLSATSPNSSELASWICKTKEKDVYLISTKKRAVPLEHMLYVKERKELIEIKKEEKYLPEGYRKARAAMSMGKSNNVSIGKNVNIEGRKTKSGSSGSSGMGKGMRVGGCLESPVQLIRLLEANKGLPAVFFDFSRGRSEQSCYSCSSLDLTTREEKSYIHTFVKTCQDRLAPEDRDLPQIGRMIPMVLKGIGVHHGGLLPIMKEMVEMLFSASMVKVLFATETFAIGLNMPTKTVVFRTLRKYKNGVYEEIEANEYIQMSGRAGRRGYDKSGTVIIECGKELVKEDVLKRVIVGEAKRLRSQFYITFGMILKLVRTGGMRIERMIEMSFGESEKKNEIREETSSTNPEREELECEICEMCEVDIEEYMKWIGRFRVETQEMYIEMLKGGKVYEIVDSRGKGRRGDVLRKGGVVIDMFGNSCVIKEVIMKADAEQIEIEVEKRAGSGCSEGEGESEDEETWMCPAVPHTMIGKIERERTPENGEVKRMRLKEVFFVSSSLENQSPLQIRSPELELNVRIEECNDCWERLCKCRCIKCPSFKHHYSKYRSRYLKAERVISLQKRFNSKNLSFVKEYFNHINLLLSLNYIDKENHLLMKGKVACEFNVINSIAITEFLFNSEVWKYDGRVIASTISCFLFNENQPDQPDQDESMDCEENEENEGTGSDVCIGITEEELLEMKRLREVVVDIDTQLRIEEEKHSITRSPLNFRVVKEIFQWTKGDTLMNIQKTSKLSEGVIVKYISKVIEGCKEIENGSRIMGNVDLAKSMEDVCTKMKRGILFTTSLYFSLTVSPLHALHSFPTPCSSEQCPHIILVLISLLCASCSLWQMSHAYALLQHGNINHLLDFL